MAKHKRIVAAIVLLVLGLLPFGLTKFANAQAVVQGYGSDTALEPGMIVQLDAKDPSKVEPATQSNIDRIHGVVVSPNDAPVSLQNISLKQQTYVATTGEYQVLVSDENGAIQKDDYITLSSLDGVGMKADSSETIVLGKALNNFNGQANPVGTSTLKEGSKTITVHLGYVAIDLSLSHNPLYQTSTKSAVLDALQRFGDSVAHKPVSLAHIYLSVAILLASVVISASMLFSGIRNGLTSIGRNPLARSHIIRIMLEVIFTSLIIFLVGIFAVYLLLKL